jgi:hypothetical protein
VYSGWIDILSWDEVNTARVRDALEYGVFNGSSMSEADVAERLLDDL